MKKIIEIIKKKWLRDTILTVLLICIIAALYIGINLWIQSMNINPLDFTQEKLYTLSEESKNQVKDIDQNVYIYFFGYTQGDNAISLANQYTNVNNKIVVASISATTRPDLAQKYNITDDTTVGIVVQAEQRYKCLSSDDLLTYDSTTYETIDITEQKLTNAIIDTTISKIPTIYFLTGHDEYSISSDMSSLVIYMENEINEVQELNLLTTEFPEDCDTLVIASPLKDFTDYETEKIISYVNNGGNILWLNDATITEQNLPNVQKVLDLYGISVDKGIIVETASSNMLISNPYLVIPKVETNTITKNVYDGIGIVLPSSGKLNIVEDEKLEELNVKVNPLVQSTDTSFYRENFETNSTSKISGDIEGSFVIAAEAQKQIGEKTSKLVVFANNIFVSNTQIQIQSQYIYAIQLYNNKDIALNSIAYLTDREDTIRIRKDVGNVKYTATQQQDTIIRIIIFGFPIAIIFAGIIVWQVRRRKK